MRRPFLVKSIITSILFLPVYVSALTISPTKIEVAADPGQTVINEIEVYNEQQEVKTFYLTYENFEPRGETGAPYFIGGGAGLASWIESTERFEIQPGEKITVPYSITVPADSPAGGYFAGIFFGTQPPLVGEESEVAIGGKVGTLVLLRVNGDINEAGGLLDFKAGDSFLLSSLPITFSYRFNNNGGDRVVPKGQITVKNSFFQEAATLAVNGIEGSVLPGSIRKFETIWEDDTLAPNASFFSIVKYQLSHFQFGVYQAILDISWGESNQHGTAKTWLVIVPWQLLLVVGALLIVLFKGLGVYNKFIISRSSHT